MDVFTENSVVENFFKGQVVTVSGRDGVRTRLRVHSYTSGFVKVNVRTGIENDRVRRLNEVSADSELVRLFEYYRDQRFHQRRNRVGQKETDHSTGNAEKTSFFASKLGDPVLQVVGSLILLLEENKAVGD